MIRKATVQDLSRIAEIIVFGKRTAYRNIFHNDKVSFHELQVIKVLEEFRKNLCDFYVEPFFKGQGIGRQLIEVVIADAKKNGRKKLFLWVIKDNLPARKFYEANGFRASGDTCIIEGTDKIDMYYELVL